MPQLLHPQAGDSKALRPMRAHGFYSLAQAGNSKMAELETRANLVAQNDFYLCPLPLNAAPDFAKWVRRATEDDQCASLIWEEDRLLGAGSEFMRSQRASIEDKELVWEERVIVVRSHSLAQSRNKQWERRLSAAQTEIENLTPPPARGKRQFTDEMALPSALEKTLKRHQVEGLLDVTYARRSRARRSNSLGRRVGVFHPPLTPLLEQVLALLGLSLTLYTQLGDNSP